MTRKSPIKHIVHKHKKRGKVINSFIRGSTVNTSKLANPVPKGKPHFLYRIYFNSKTAVHHAVKSLYDVHPAIDASVTDMDQLQWIDVYGMTGRNFIQKKYKDFITDITKMSLTKPKIINKPAWAKGMRKEAWYWVDRKGKKWQAHFDGTKTEVNMNRSYT